MSVFECEKHGEQKAVMQLKGAYFCMSCIKEKLEQVGINPLSAQAPKPETPHSDAPQ